MKDRFDLTLKQFNIQKDSSEDDFVDYFDTVRVDPESTFLEDDIRVEFNTAFQMKIANEIIHTFHDLCVKAGHDTSKITLLDVGSKFSEALSFSSYFPTIFTECRHGIPKGRYLEIPGLNLGLLNCEAQDLETHIMPGAVKIITSLHALEHFGLGRYGDEIDYYGDQKALSVFNNLLGEKGALILSVPFTVYDSPRIEFNGQRVYNFKTIDSMLDKSGFKLEDRWFIFPLGSFRDPADKESPAIPVIKNIEQVNSMTDSYETRENYGVYLTLSRKGGIS
jgi:hypothetical protein